VNGLQANTLTLTGKKIFDSLEEREKTYTEREKGERQVRDR
jgi:hypothetical protein